MKKSTKVILTTTTAIALTTLIIGLINKLVYLFISLEDRLKSDNSYYYQWKFGKIHYTKHGQGKPLLLIHSLRNGSSHYEWNKITQFLAKGHTVYTLDLIGFGQSEKPKFIYTAYLYVQLISDFITDVIDDIPDIVTSGKSNSFASMVAKQNQTLVGKLVFINPEELKLLSKNPSTIDTILKYILETPILGTMIYNIISSKYFLNRKFKKYYTNYHNSYLNKFVNAFYESAHLGESSNKYAYASNYCKFTNVNINQSIKELNHSMFIIQGSERDVDPTFVASTYKMLNASIESSTINKAKRFPHFENPDATLKLLSIYLHD